MGGGMTERPIEPGDEVIYPADNPRSQFLSRVESIEGETAICQPLTGGDPFPVAICKLRHHKREAS
jgi:hypothetical protein